MQGLIGPRCILWLYEVLRSWDACRDSRVRGRIDLWLFVPLVIVLSIVFGSLLLRTFKIVFYTDMLLIYHNK
jgi:hypothetical protein